MSQDNHDPLRNLKEAAEILRFSSAQSLSSTLYRKTYPDLNASLIRIGKRPFFRQSALDDFIARRSQTKAAV